MWLTCMLHHAWPTLQAALEKQQLEQSRRLKTLREASLRASAAEQQLKAGGWLQGFSAHQALYATQVTPEPTLIACPAVQAQAHSLEQAAQRRAEGLNAALQEVTVQALRVSGLRDSHNPGIHWPSALCSHPLSHCTAGCCLGSCVQCGNSPSVSTCTKIVPCPAARCSTNQCAGPSTA